MARSNKFGTFGGVFTPSILTILGVIMYMRLPMIVGNAGLYATIGIIVVAHLISITTGLSVSSIATDKKVEAGGTYYMISRSLGLPIGGTLGLALFVGLSFSVSLYLIGFAESFLGFFGYEINKDNIRMAGSAILLLVTIITFISTSLALKTQYFIMAAIFLSLLSVIFGKHEFTPVQPNLLGTGGGIGLMVLFGIFFPAVTGFEAGVSMSGDLKDPKKSIPLGSISAIFVGLVVYIALAFFLSYTVAADKLANDPKILLKISRIPQFVIAGIWGATLSSALGSILGAPRILQATAVDRITPRFFAKGTGKTNEPRNALLLTFLIAEAGILIGELNLIARIVSIFFITTYGFLNLSCAFEAMTSADFRPSFKSPVWVSLLGSITAMIVMIQLDFVAMLGATIFLGALYFFLKRRELVLQTGDAWSGIWASLVKTGLKRLRENKLQERNWRPNIIMFSGNEADRPALVQLGKNITSRLGIMTGFNLVETSEELIVKQASVREKEKAVSDYFLTTHYCHDLYTGMDEVMRVYGYSGMEPNTVLMGWSKKPARKENFLKLISRLEKNNFNSIFLSQNPEKKSSRKQIDVWWSGWGSNLSFALNLLRHITASPYWKDARLRLLVVCNDSVLMDSVHHSLKKVLEKYRIEMEIKIINNAVEQLPRNTLIINESSQCELAIIGISNEKYEKIEKTYDEINELVKQMSSTLLINASGTFESYDLLDRSKLMSNHKLTVIKDQQIPELQLSKIPEISTEIVEIEKKGQANITTLFNTVFITGFRECKLLLEAANSLGQSLIFKLDKIHSTKERHQKEKILSRARNDFFFNSQNAVSQYLNEKLLNRKEMFEKGLASYLETTNLLVNELPKKLKIKHDRIEFQRDNADSSRLRRFKRRRVLFHPFSKSITIKAKFQKISKYYLIENRLSHIEQSLKKIRDYDLAFMAQIRNYFTQIREIIAIVENEITDSNNPIIDLPEIKQKLNEPIQVLEKDLHEVMSSLDIQMQLEFRKTCQKLSNDFEKIRINKLLKGKRRSKKFYRQLHKRIIGFNEVWFDEMKNQTNRVYLDLLIDATKDRITRETSDFLLSISQQVNVGHLNPIRQLGKNIEKSLKTARNSKQIHEFQIGFKLDYLQDIENLTNEIHQLVDALPEEIQISDKSQNEALTGKQTDQESIRKTIPTQRIVRHYVDSVFLALFPELLKNFSEELKKQEYRIKDHLSYFEFEIENLIDDSDFEKRSKELIEITLAEIEDEEKKIRNILHKLIEDVESMINKAFEPASSHLIAESSQRITHLIREYQGRQTVSKFGALRDRLEAFIKSKTVRLLYSQSEGILFARKITEEHAVLSMHEQIAELVDQLVPEYKVQSKIPAYYMNLFSGKSSIGEDFWIERQKEENQFVKALNRYKHYRRGGIIIYGERNCGKTALSKYLTKKYFRPDQVLHVFAPWQGSSRLEDFELALQKASGMKGSVESIADSLRFDSVLVIHDLELWWERTDEGFAVISHILKLINNYSDQFLVVINMNLYAYNFLNTLYAIEDNFTMHIHCRPFDSEDLKELIMRRHRSSGLSFVIGKRRDDQVSEIKLASVFNRIFRISTGNPGFALNIWLSMITRYADENIIIKMPQIPDFNAIELLDEDWKILLAQMILHKRATVEKLAGILGIPVSDVQKQIQAMLMCGIIVERNTDLFIVNSYLNNAICEVLSKNDLI